MAVKSQTQVSTADFLLAFYDAVKHPDRLKEGAKALADAESLSEERKEEARKANEVISKSNSLKADMEQREQRLNSDIAAYESNVQALEAAKASFSESVSKQSEIVRMLEERELNVSSKERAQNDRDAAQNSREQGFELREDSLLKREADMADREARARAYFSNGVPE